MTYGVFAEIKKLVDAQLQALDEVLEGDLAAFNDRVRQLQLPAVMPKRTRQAIQV